MTTFSLWPTISPSAWTNGKIRQKSILTPVPKSTKSKFRNRRKTKKQTGKEAKPQNIPFTTSYHSQFDINCFYKGVFHEHIPSFAVSPALAVFSVSAFIPMPSSADFSFDTGHRLLPAFSSPKHCSKRPGAGREFPIAKRNPHAKPGLFVCGYPPSRYRQTPKGYKTA